MFITHLTHFIFVSICGPAPKVQGHWPQESTPAWNRYSSSDLGDEHSYTRLLWHPSNKISVLLGARSDWLFTPRRMPHLQPTTFISPSLAQLTSKSLIYSDMSSFQIHSHPGCVSPLTINKVILWTLYKETPKQKRWLTVAIPQNTNHLSLTSPSHH